MKFGESLGSPLAWPAPAKLNLFLHIVGRRLDGYHLLQTAFQFIDLCDELRFYQRAAGVIERVAGPADIPTEQDLVIRAARLLAEVTHTNQGVAIALSKNIPLQAGLGGGSSDAATVLVALNKLWVCGLTTAQLAELGLRLGADVPVFVQGHAAWAEGVGEQLTPIEPSELSYFLIQPPVAVSTAEIFQASELTRDTPLTTIRAFRAGDGHNDCAPTVRARYPLIGQALDWLSAYGDARLTGTGACVFAGWSERAAAERVAAQLRASAWATGSTPWRGFVVQGRNRSPLLERMQQAD